MGEAVIDLAFRILQIETVEIKYVFLLMDANNSIYSFVFII